MEEFPVISSKHVTEAYMLIREYSVYFAGLGQVRFKIWQNDRAYGGDWYSFTQSHYFHGPGQAGPYVTSAPFASSEELALSKAIGTITTFYKPELATDENPSEKWLKVNTSF